MKGLYLLSANANLTPSQRIILAVFDVVLAAMIFWLIWVASVD